KNVRHRARLDPVNEQHVAAAAAAPAATSAPQEKKAGGLMKVRWRWVDVEGREGEEELDRAAVMQRTGLHARDLRILDPLLSYPSTILGRERAIVLNLEHLKAIITAEEVLLRNPAHEGVQRFVDELLRRLHLQPAAGPPAAGPPAAGPLAAVLGSAEAASPGATRSASAAPPAPIGIASHVGAAAGGAVSGADGSARRHDSDSGEAREVDRGGGGREGLPEGSEGTRETGNAAYGSNAARRVDERRRVCATPEIEMVECEGRERRGPVDGEGDEEEDEEEEEDDAWEGMGSAHGSGAESEPLTLRLRVKDGGGGKGTGLQAEGGERGGGERGAKGWQHEEEEEDDEDMEEYRPFEFIALEVALEQVCRALDSHTTLLENEAYPALDELTSRVSSLNLDRVRSMKNRMSRLIARVQKVREELEQLLDDDDDMAEMFLTRMAAAPHSPTATSLHGAASLAFSLSAPATLHAPFASPHLATSPLGSRMSIGGRWGGMGMGAGGGGMAALMSRASAYSSAHSDNDDIEELEQLLESYFVQIDSILNNLFTLREYIDDTEDYINIQIDNHRNQLIQLELVLNAGIMGTSISATVVGIFGMNIPYAWNTDPSAFVW
ncbi:unnamed protein product, partial [Closterium sp. NIES-53]